MTPPAIILGYRRPRHQKQLQQASPTKSTNCGPCSVTVAVEALTRGRVVVSPNEAPRFIRELRREMGTPTGPTTLPEHDKALTSRLVDGVALAVNERPAGVLVVTATHEMCADSLKAGKALVVLVDYGAINDLMPRLSGSQTFRGLHFVTLLGYAKDHQGEWSYLYDPLHDGRRQGIPRGVQSVRIRRYLQAAESAGSPQAGNGHAKVAIVRSAT